MITVPIIILLFIFGVFLLFWLIFSFVAMYHIMAFGFKNMATFVATFAYIIVSVIILATSYNSIVVIDWTTEMFSFDKSMFSSSINFIPSKSE